MRGEFYGRIYFAGDVFLANPQPEYSDCSGTLSCTESLLRLSQVLVLSQARLSDPGTLLANFVETAVVGVYHPDEMLQEQGMISERREIELGL